MAEGVEAVLPENRPSVTGSGGVGAEASVGTRVLAGEPVAGAGPAAAARPGLRIQTFSSLRHRDYRLLWIGTLFSSSGQWIQQVTLSWLVYQMTGSGALLGAINGFRSLPMLVLGPFGGVAADRVDRKKLMLGTQVWLMVLTAVFAVLIATDLIRVWQLFIFTLLTGVAWAFNMPVRQSVVPNLVPKEDLMNAVALNSAGFNITRVVGPSAAGALIALVGAAANFGIQASAYLGVSVMIMLMTIPPLKQTARHTVSVGSNLREGLAYVWHHPTLRTQMAIALVPMILAMPYMTIMPIFAKDVLHVGPGGFGLMMSAPGIGALIGTLSIATIGDVKRKGLLMLGALFAMGLSLILFSFSRNFTLSLLILVLIGMTMMSYMTTNNTLIQVSSPDEMRGRVMGIYMLNQGLMPLGSLLAGGVSDLISAPFAVLCMGTATCIFALLFLFKASGFRAA